jgi:DNA-binding CsgD family transcriptional regulator
MPPSSVCSDSMNSSFALPNAWAAVSAEIVECLDEAILPELLVCALSTLIRFEHCGQFVYRKDARPIHVYDTYLSSCAKAGLNNYVNSTYVLDPFYRSYRVGLKTGAYRVPDLAPDLSFDREDFSNFKVSVSSSEEIGYLTDGWPPGRQELCIALEMPMGECAAITLARKAGEGGFSATDGALLTPVIPFLAASYRRYWRHARETHVGGRSHGRFDADPKVLDGLNLSPREREIAQLLLRGHSTLSVSLQLNISITTVKTHRKNLYAKLGIATQCELFSLLWTRCGSDTYGFRQQFPHPRPARDMRA